MPIWIRRAVLAAAAGVVVGIWLDWRVGLTAAAAVAILDTVHRSRTTAVIPAAVRVTSAQRRTRRRLFWARRSGYLTLNGRAIPGTNCIIDHLVVGPAGVFAVDSERWDRRLPLRATQGGHLYHGPYSQTGRLKHAQLEAGLAGQLISEALGRKQRIRPAMVIYGPTRAVDRSPDQRRGRVQRAAAPQVPAGPGPGPPRAAADPRGGRAHPRRRRQGAPAPLRRPPPRLVNVWRAPARVRARRGSPAGAASRPAVIGVGCAPPAGRNPPQ